MGKRAREKRQPKKSSRNAGKRSTGRLEARSDSSDRSVVEAMPAHSSAEPEAVVSGAAKSFDRSANGGGGPTVSPSTQKHPDATDIIGQVAWLMTRSPAHKHLFLADLEWLVLPPVMLRQFRIFRRKSTPVAYISWASVNEETEGRLAKGLPRLKAGEWRSGDRIWLVDVVAPFGSADAVIRDLREKVFPDRTVKTMRMSSDGKNLEVVEIGALPLA